LSIPVPGSEQRLSIVTQYKHLGTVVSADGSGVPGARSKRDAAMCAYVPIAIKIFGAPRSKVGDWLKLLFMHSLVLSRATFNVHITVVSPREMAIYNGVYMRVLRRIGGSMRFGETISDYEVRRQMGQPSIDCLLVRHRLLYLRRLLVHRPRALLGLLSQRPGGAMMPWTKAAVDDMCLLRDRVGSIGRLGDPCENPAHWYGFITGDGSGWESAVDALFFVESICDKSRPSEPLACPAPRAVTVHTCPDCASDGLSVCFASDKALQSHRRAKHGYRTEMRFYVGSDGICPVCQKRFVTRLRCLAHLRDTRRRDCSSVILGGSVRRLEQHVVDELDGADRVARRCAFREGHTQPLAKGAATTADGTIIGRVRM
jgi:hypothetical protein